MNKDAGFCVTCFCTVFRGSLNSYSASRGVQTLMFVSICCYYSGICYSALGAVTSTKKTGLFVTMFLMF